MSQPISPLCYWHPAFDEHSPAKLKTDVCVYGGTAGGVVAAIQLARLGHRVVLLEPGPRVGGMTASGLGYTDIGNKAAVGGLAREFYRRVGRAYGVAEAWTFEPKVAQQVFDDWLRECKVPVLCRQYLADVVMAQGRIEELRTTTGVSVRARMFLDCTYEGDLMAAAGVRHTIGREDDTVYGETLNGAQVRNKHQFDLPVSPFVVPDRPESGLLPGFDAEAPVTGKGDHRIQAYCFRMCLTDDPANRLPFPKPARYDRSRYVLLERYLAAGWREVFQKFDRLRVRMKTDTNNHGAVSTDFIGQNYRWPAGTFVEREEMFQAHVAYQQGYHWFLANDPGVPDDVREAYAKWGLCRDEFVETGGWPYQLYVREARRLVGDYVMTEHECRGTRVVPDPVGLAAYTMDSHNCRRFVRDGAACNEGDVQEHGFPPYPISYRSIIPAGGQCENLLVPVCLSASHIAYGSIRMEPVFMVLGQSAALAADLAIKASGAVQAVSYSLLNRALTETGQILEWKADEAEIGGEHVLHAQEN